MDDRQIILRIRSGHPRSFDLLYRKYAASLLGFIRRYVQSPAAAEDIFHEAFLQVIRNLNLEFERARFSTWLFKVARNLALNHLRAERPAAPESALASLAGPTTPEREVAGRELVEKVLARVSPEHREVFLLRQREGLSYEEIAEILECPVGTVRSRLHYCVKELQRSVKEVLGELS
jgi:RNA polymerase sigma-70 factor, ECF subfamily